MIVALVAAVLAVPQAAWAHSQLLSTTPTAGATVTAPISEVTLTFNEPVHQKFSVVVVNGPGGASYSAGHVQVIDSVVHQPVHPLRSGSYTVAWRVVSADGHPVEGRFGFTVALPASLEPSAGPAAGSPAASPSHPAIAAGTRTGARWPWLLGGGVLAIGAVVVAGVAKAKRP
ncbi:copper resistance protein CopC [Planosporangium thailandense]|uniref:Copper resistance protein CopC n=1 Tax=Planosporangium thailandense TaxID=765197 RepID=A0ABX0Y305_9ACTN|nr:copper resistance CopC family protein [Planosporangium thailandense]NJC72461.1 copper resistance protein CopC [Planosporangium thailandense]